MTAFSIEEFRANTMSGAAGGFMRGSNFLATIPAPRCLASGASKAQKMSFLCRAASVPGYSITASDERPYGVGPDIKMPHGHAHSDLTLTFYVDARYDAVDFFHAWVKSIAPSTDTLARPYNGAFDGEIRYRNEYISDITIAHYSDNSKIAVITFKEAWPTQVNEIPLDWASGDEIIQLTVTFTYRAYKLQLVNEPVTISSTNLRGAIPSQQFSSINSSTRPSLQGPALSFYNGSQIRPALFTTNYSISQLSSMDYPGFSGVNDAAMAIRDVTSNISFGMNSVLSSVLGFAPVQSLLRGLSSASNLTGALNSLRNIRSNIQGAMTLNLGGARSQLQNITRGIGGLGRIP